MRKNLYLTIPAFFFLILSVGIQTGWAKQDNTEINRWDNDCTKTVKELLVNNSKMDIWRGAMPMANLKDFEAYVNTFKYWARLAVCCDSNVVKDFRNKAINIQMEALPKLRTAFAYYVLESSGLPANKIDVEFLNGDVHSGVRFIWTDVFSPPPDFVDKIYSSYEPHWWSLRFLSVRFSKQGSTGLISINKFAHYNLKGVNIFDSNVSRNLDKKLQYY